MVARQRLKVTEKVGQRLAHERTAWVFLDDALAAAEVFTFTDVAAAVALSPGSVSVRILCGPYGP